MGIVIKPGLAWLVNLGPGDWIGPDLPKDRPVQRLGRPMTRATRKDLVVFFFSNVIFLLHPSFLYFFSWLLILFKAHCINITKVFYFFNVGFETF